MSIHLIKYAQWPLALLMLVLTAGLGFFAQQHEFSKIIAFYAPLFSLYVFVNAGASSMLAQGSSLHFWLALAILLRLLLVFSLPNLSNDVYRFIWDGRLLIQGYNPFDHLPLYYLENNIAVEGINRELFEAFGAKNTYTSYPPIAQAQFASACWLFPDNIYWCSVVMKLWLFLFEIGSIFLLLQLLRRFQLPEKNVLLYALNPLIIIEITGNLHFEGAMIFFLLLALWLLTADCRLRTGLCHFLSAAAFAFSICSKLLTLLFLPYLVKTLGWKKSLAYYATTAAVTVLLFLPVVNETFLFNFSNSLGLYFQKLEYNASLYYLLRWLGFQIWGYNQIALFGPLLGLLVFIGIGITAFRLSFCTPFTANGTNVGQQDSLKAVLPGQWLFAICLYLICTTTLHPWYLALPVVLCVFTKWRFPIVWSGTVFLTYVNYSYTPYHENLWIVALEYTIVFVWWWWEWKTYRQKQA
jgi:hypothetical protein